MGNLVESKFDVAIRAVCEKFYQHLINLPLDVKKQVQEIRFRINKPVTVCCINGIYFLNENGRLDCRPDINSMIVTKNDMDTCFRNICNFSIYSHQNEIKNGYVTLSGGHRVGICGTAVFQNDKISSIRDISSINIRISREIEGAANEIFKLLKKDIKSGLLLVGSPASGKTTMLRDIARQISSGTLGDIKKVAVVDERGELAGTCLGVPQNDLGYCTYVLDGYPKAEGIMQAVRSLSPDYVICDELGGYDEVYAVEQCLNAGVSMISTIHAGSVNELLMKKQAVSLLKTRAFGFVALLNGHAQPGKLMGIFKAGDLLAKIRGDSDSDCRRDTCGIYGVA